MKKNILFIGAGGFASECYTLLQDIIKEDNSLAFKGFLSTSNDLEPYKLSHLFLGHYDNYDFKENDYAVIVIGNPNVRKTLYGELKNRGVKFYTLISKKAIVSNPENIGEGSIICCFCTIASNVKMGVCNVINSLSGIGHDSSLGNFNVLSSHSDICGFTTIGDCNFFGSRCSTLPHTKIGNNNKISAGSVVVKRCRDNCVMHGIPAIKICDTNDL